MDLNYIPLHLKKKRFSITVSRTETITYIYTIFKKVHKIFQNYVHLQTYRIKLHSTSFEKNYNQTTTISTTKIPTYIYIIIKNSSKNFPKLYTFKKL